VLSQNLRQNLSKEGFADGASKIAAVCSDVSTSGQFRIFDWLTVRELPFLIAAGEPRELLIQGSPTNAVALSHVLNEPIGWSQPFVDLADYRTALSQARIAAEAMHTQGNLSSQTYAPGRSYLTYLPRDNGELSLVAQTVLGGLQTYDNQNASHLVESLRAYLESNRKLKNAAARLFIHPNTLAYRIRLIERLTASSLDEVSVQTDFWIALEASRLSSET
jgi:DNA-binding PucR family transcriptional regulator